MACGSPSHNIPSLQCLGILEDGVIAQIRTKNESCYCRYTYQEPVLLRSFDLYENKLPLSATSVSGLPLNNCRSETREDFIFKLLESL